MQNLGKRYEIYHSGKKIPTTSFDEFKDAEEYFETSKRVWDKNRVMLRDKETNQKTIYSPQQFELWN